MKNAYVVMYHYVRELEKSRYPQIKGLDIKKFKQQIEFFKQNFNIVTMEEVIAAYTESYELPERAMLLTFDDGYIDHYLNVFPILNDYKIQGSFFPVSSSSKEHTLLDVNKIHFILASTPIEQLINDLRHEYELYKCDCKFGDYDEVYNQYAVGNRFDSGDVIFFKRMLQTILPEEIRGLITSKIFEQRVGIPEDTFARELYINYDQIKCMKKAGMYFGIHGHSHYWLGNLEQKQMQQDIDEALEFMGEFIDGDKWVMNYPYGSHNEETIEYIKSKGCALGLTTEVRMLDVSLDDCFRIPRLDTNDFPPKSDKYKSINKKIRMSV